MSRKQRLLRAAILDRGTAPINLSHRLSRSAQRAENVSFVALGFFVGTISHGLAEATLILSHSYEHWFSFTTARGGPAGSGRQPDRLKTIFKT